MTQDQVILLGAGSGLVLSVAPFSWHWVRYLMTLVHEVGHMIAAWSVGHFVTGVQLHRGSGGFMTHFSPSARGASFLWVSWWGYAFPAVVGLALTWAALNGWSGAALSLFAVMAGFVLLWSRSWHTVRVIVAVLAGLVLVLLLSGAGVRAGFAAGLGVALLIGAARGLGMVTRAIRGGTTSTDANYLGRATHIPVPGWLLSWAVVIGGCLWLGGGMLVDLASAEFPIDDLLAVAKDPVPGG